MDEKIKIILAFLITIIVLGFFSLNFAFTPSYVAGFVTGTVEVALIIIYLLVLKNIIDSELRKKIYSYSIQIVTIPFLVIPIVISFFTQDKNSYKIALVSYGTAMFVWFGLFALLKFFKKTYDKLKH